MEKQQIINLIKTGLKNQKLSDDIVSDVLEKFPDADDETILKCLDTAKKSIQLEKRFSVESSEFSEKKSNVDTESEDDGADSVKKLVDAAVDNALKGLPSVQNPLKSAAEDETKMVSFLKHSIKSSSWKSAMREMLLADRAKDYKYAREISNDFLKSSNLYSNEYKEARLKQKAALTGDSATGSYAVPDMFSDQVFAVAQAASYCFNNATKLSMESDKLYLLGAGDVSFTEVANQSTALTESEPTLTQTSLDLVDSGAYSYIHDNLIADSNVDIISLLANSYGRGFAKYLKRATTVGNVATTGDLLNGIFSTSGIGSVTCADPAGTISYKDLVDLEGAVDDSFLDGCVFEMNRREFSKIRGIVDGAGRPILTTPDAGYRNYFLLGYPVAINNQMPVTLDATTSARTAGTTATILFYNPREVQIGIKGGFELESSMHYAFTSRKTTFRGFVRWAQALVNASAAAALRGIAA